MAVSLAEAKNNTATPLDANVIDEFRKESAILDTLGFDDVVSAASGAGGVLSHSYRRLKTQPTSAFRALNTEYTPSNVETEIKTSALAVLGGSFEVDRIIAQLGAAASGAVQVNLLQKIKATTTKFQDAVINGDTATDANAFDGLDKALVGTSTEVNADGTGAYDWSDLGTQEKVFSVYDQLDDFLSLLDGTPTVIVGNRDVLARLRAAARRANQYVESPVEGLLGADGRPIVRQSIGSGILLVDAGNKAGTNDPIIPTVAGKTSLYAYRVGPDGFYGVTTIGGRVVKTWLPDFTTSNAVKKGEVELGPIGVELRATKAAAVLRNIKVRGA